MSANVQGRGRCPSAINGLFGPYGDHPNMEFVERVDVFHGPSAFGWNRVRQIGNYAEGYDAGPSQPYNLYTPYRPASPNFVAPEQPTDYLIDDESTNGWYLGDTIATLRGKLLLTVDSGVQP